MTEKVVLSILLLVMPLCSPAQQQVLPPAQQTAQPVALPAAEPTAQPATQTATPTSKPLPRAGSDWTMVEAVTPGTTLYVNAKGGHTSCKVKSVSDEAIACSGKSALYARADIWSIKIGHRGRSALIGAIPGGVLMAAGGIGQATENCTGKFFCGLGPAVVEVGGVAIAVVGASVGALTDFSKSTIYTAP